MQLKQFLIQNYRSIIDSGLIDVGQLTAFIGRNESGKSNVLRALRMINPIGEMKKPSPTNDFPRNLRRSECNDSTLIVQTFWKLNDTDKATLVEILPQISNIDQIAVLLDYAGERHVFFGNNLSPEFDFANSGKIIDAFLVSLRKNISNLEESKRATVAEEIKTFADAATPGDDQFHWAEVTAPALIKLSEAITAQKIEIDDNTVEQAEIVDSAVSAINNFRENKIKASKWVLSNMPKFIYLDDYEELNGHQNLVEFMKRKSEDKLTSADINFAKMCKVANLNIDLLHSSLGAEDNVTRNTLVNDASDVMTEKMRRWHDRDLSIRFDPDAEHLNTYVFDSSSRMFKGEVNLNERSRGFKWFFSFYVIFAADTEGGVAENAILLLDEPGLYLHAKSQRDLLDHLKNDFRNQVMFTTHSPFMVPTDDLDSIRTVNINDDSETTVSNIPSGDSRTIFPLQAALGYDLSQSMFIGNHNLVVEGPTDYWVFSSVSNYLNAHGKTGLDRHITITPAGGASKAPAMVRFLSSGGLNVAVILDSDSEGQTARAEIVTKDKCIKDKAVFYVSAALGGSGEWDMEDLLDSKAYGALVQECYSNDLKGKKLNLNNKIPRIVKRYEEAFQKIDLEFNKTRVARLFLDKIKENPESVVSADTAAKFATLFELVNKSLRISKDKNQAKQ